VTGRLLLGYGPAPWGDPIEEDFVKTMVSLAALLLAFSAGAAAQEKQSFKTILGKGYEIKSVTFVPKSETTENREAFLVTLQKDKSVAVCYFAASTWISLVNQTLEDSARCDVR
jgi:hypothetical protein